MYPLVCKRSIDVSNTTSEVNYPIMSTYDGSVLTPWQGNLRLNNLSTVPSAWCAPKNDSNKTQFLQLDFRIVKVVRTIAVQAHPTENKWIRSFTLSSSLAGIFWKEYKEEGNLKVISVVIVNTTLLNVDMVYRLETHAETGAHVPPVLVNFKGMLN